MRRKGAVGGSQDVAEGEGRQGLHALTQRGQVVWRAQTARTLVSPP
jgi:hypothetical protein